MFFFHYFSEQLDAIALKKLVHFVNELMEQYFDFIRRRMQLEVCSNFRYNYQSNLITSRVLVISVTILQKETGDNTILVRALDRFHRRLQAMNKLLPDTDFSR